MASNAAVQEDVADVCVMLLVAKPEGALQVVAAKVVKLRTVEYTLVPPEQFAEILIL